MSSFNPRPLLLTGESLDQVGHTPLSFGFNPRPLLLTGESYGAAGHQRFAQVSIHARYC